MSARTLRSPKLRARPKTRHAHCDQCLKSFVLEDLAEFGLLTTTRFRTRILDTACAEALRRAGEVVDFVGAVQR